MASDKAAFLGPKSENYEILERLILEALRDQVYWRRNFYPSDPPAIEEVDKTSADYLSVNARLHQELYSILAELKRGVPFYSLRYLGHINSDLLIPAIVGYFAAMLYNQNNVVAESSPVTVVKELEYIKALARMLGLPKLDYRKLNLSPEESSWGHLSSGGTTANIEALWATRNITFYPLSLRLLADQHRDYAFVKDLRVTLPNGSTGSIESLSAYELLSLSPSGILGLRRALIAGADRAGRGGEVEDVLPTLQKLGMARFRDMCRDQGMEFKIPNVLIPRTVHYCWPKGMDIIGLGKESLIEVEVDEQFRMEIADLKLKLSSLNQGEIPILSVISVCGTTEEGAIDPLHEILHLRKECERDANVSFWVHSDAAYGGYFASMLRGNTDMVMRNEERFPGIDALGKVDSVVIDPHKLGYVPYPAGAVLYRDARVREHLAYEAPYLQTKEDVTKEFLGKWTLEGSRPGAAAISCYLAQHCFPLDLSGYGNILMKCKTATQELIRAFDTVNNDPNRNKGFRILRLFEPELNVVCYAVASPFLNSPQSLNEMTGRIFSRLTVTAESPTNHYDYVVSKTEYPVERYPKQVVTFLKECGMSRPTLSDKMNAQYSLITLRSVLMNPLAQGMTDYFEGFAANLCRIADEVLPAIQLRIIRQAFSDRPENRRMKVLIVEDEDEERQTLKYQLEMEEPISTAIEITTAASMAAALNEFTRMDPDAAVVDLKLNKREEDFTGIELIGKLKDKGFNSIIVHSAYLDDPVVDSMLEELGVKEEYRIRKASKDHTKRNLLNALVSFLNGQTGD